MVYALYMVFTLYVLFTFYMVYTLFMLCITLLYLKEENTELVVVCCKFLSYFSRTSRQNQASMFQHLSYILDNSAMLLARPSLRGSVPLDVAVSSLMDNNDLSLALRETHLEKITIYLSRCGLQTNSELYAKGYPDVGWDPVEGERLQFKIYNRLFQIVLLMIYRVIFSNW